MNAVRAVFRKSEPPPSLAAAITEAEEVATETWAMVRAQLMEQRTKELHK